MCSNPNNNLKCKKEIVYKNEYTYKNGINKNALCKSCVTSQNNKNRSKELYKQIGEKGSKSLKIFYQSKEGMILKKYFSKLRKGKTVEELYGEEKGKNIKNKLRKATSGKNNPMYGKGYLLKGDKNGMYRKSVKDVWINKHGLEKANDLQKEMNEKNSKSNSGTNNPMYGISVYDKWLEKYGKEIADKKYQEFCKQKRIDLINKRKRNGTWFWQSYNESACEIFNWINMYYNFNFQHALYNGKFAITKLGYFLDAYDEKQNTVIEFYEKHHYDKFGNLKQKELNREQEIIKYLNCEFIRINAFDKNNLILEKIA